MKEKDSASEPKINGRPRGGARKGGSKAGRVKSDKLPAEIEHYRERVAGDEERLRTGRRPSPRLPAASRRGLLKARLL